MAQQIPKLQYKDGTPMRKIKTNYVNEFKTDSMAQQTPWFERFINPILRKIFKLEITSLKLNDKIIGYGIVKKL